MHKLIRSKIILLLAFLITANLAYSSVMEDIEFRTLGNEQLQIRVSFDAPPPTPGTYSISDPARIAVDLPGVVNQLPSRKYPIDFDNVDSLVAIEAGGRSRLVINLTELVEYELYAEGTELVINVAASSAGSAEVVGSLLSSQRTGQFISDSSVTELDFQRGDQGEGRLMVRLTDPTVDVDVSKQGEYIIVKLLNTYISDDQRHVYDVLDFATAVKEFSADQQGGHTIIRVLPESATDYLAYQTDDVFVVSVAPIESGAIAGTSSGVKEEFSGDRLSLNFQDIEVRAVLQIIADFTGLNLVASDNVTGSITLRLDNVPWDQALDIVLKTKGLAKRVNGSVMLVANAEEIAEQERIELESNKQLVELLPLQTEHMKILYAKSTELAAMFTAGEDGESGLLSERGSVLIDERTNSLIVTDTAEHLVEIRKLIDLLDIPVKQVMIEARIVSASDDFSRELGIRWGGASMNSDSVLAGSLESSTDIASQIQSRSAEFNSSVLGGTSAAEAAANLEPISVTFPDALFVDLGVGGAPSALALSYLGDSFNIGAELSALESRGEGEIISQPKVITGDKQQATIKAGQEVGFQQATASGATSVAFKEAVLQLDVTPNITPENRILMDLIVTQDSISGFVSGQNNSQIPVLDTTEVGTQVLVNNGETIVLGGVFEQADLRNVVKTPLLGDLPVLGRLFKRTVNTQVKRETLIFITPRIVNESLSN